MPLAQMLDVCIQRCCVPTFLLSYTLSEQVTPPLLLRPRDCNKFPDVRRIQDRAVGKACVEAGTRRLGRTCGTPAPPQHYTSIPESTTYRLVHITICSPRPTRNEHHRLRQCGRRRASCSPRAPPRPRQCARASRPSSVTCADILSSSPRH